MINALHSSKEGGTQTFTLNQSQFGWSTITRRYNCECEQVRQDNDKNGCLNDMSYETPGQS